MVIRDVNMWRTGQVDRRAESCFFTDEELNDFLAIVGGDFWSAAASALESLLADSRAMLNAIKNGTWGENYSDAEKRIGRLINAYKAKSDAYAPTMIILETGWSETAVSEYMGRVESDESYDFEDATDFDKL